MSYSYSKYQLNVIYLKQVLLEYPSYWYSRYLLDILYVLQVRVEIYYTRNLFNVLLIFPCEPWLPEVEVHMYAWYLKLPIALDQ